MSAAARAAGPPTGDRPGRRPPPPVTVVRPGPRSADGSPAAGRPATGEHAAPAVRTDRSAGPAPARPVRGHTAPVRAGAPRNRPAARPTRGPGTAVPATAAPPSPGARSAPGTGRAPVVLLVVTLLVATTLGSLFLNTAIAVNSLKATQLAAANEDRAQEVQRLERQVISGGTPAELAAAARAAGMVPAGAAAYLVVGEDGTVVLRGEPVPAEAPEQAPAPATPPPASPAPATPTPVAPPAGSGD